MRESEREKNVHQTVVGVFESYADSEATLQDLELAGIVGEQVEVIRNLDQDDRTAQLGDEVESGANRKEGLLERAEHALHKHPEPKDDVRDDSGDQPQYIGRQEFYATHVREGHTVVIVRGPNSLAERARGILDGHGAKAPSGGAVQVTNEDDRPRAASSSA